MLAAFLLGYGFAAVIACAVALAAYRVLERVL